MDATWVIFELKINKKATRVTHNLKKIKKENGIGFALERDCSQHHIHHSSSKIPRDTTHEQPYPPPNSNQTSPPANSQQQSVNFHLGFLIVQKNIVSLSVFYLGFLISLFTLLI